MASSFSSKLGFPPLGRQHRDKTRVWTYYNYLLSRNVRKKAEVLMGLASRSVPSSTYLITFNFEQDNKSFICFIPILKWHPITPLECLCDNNFTKLQKWRQCLLIIKIECNWQTIITKVTFLSFICFCFILFFVFIVLFCFIFSLFCFIYFVCLFVYFSLFVPLSKTFMKWITCHAINSKNKKISKKRKTYKECWR